MDFFWNQAGNSIGVLAHQAVDSLSVEHVKYDLKTHYELVQAPSLDL